MVEDVIGGLWVVCEDDEGEFGVDDVFVVFDVEVEVVVFVDLCEGVE